MKKTTHAHPQKRHCKERTLPPQMPPLVPPSLLFSWPWKSRLSTSSNNLPSCDAFDAAIAATEMVTEHMLVPGPDGTYSGSQRLGRNVLTALSSAWPLDRMGNSPHRISLKPSPSSGRASTPLGVRRIGLLEGFRPLARLFFPTLDRHGIAFDCRTIQIAGSAEETSHSRQNAPLLTYSSIPRDAAVSAIIPPRALAWLETVLRGLPCTLIERTGTSR